MAQPISGTAWAFNTCADLFCVYALNRYHYVRFAKEGSQKLSLLGICMIKDLSDEFSSAVLSRLLRLHSLVIMYCISFAGIGFFYHVNTAE